MAWRWLFGIPALWLLYREGTKILAAAPLESTGILQFSLQDPWKAAVVLSGYGGGDDAADCEDGDYGWCLCWRWRGRLFPAWAERWCCAASMLRCRFATVSDRHCRLLRVVALGAVFAAWFFGLQWAATATLSGPGEPNLLAVFRYW